MFLDTKELRLQAGKGGDGAILFRHEKYVPRGGPDGGDGGRGGSIWVRARRNLHTLVHLSHVAEVKAEPGEKGGHQRASGHAGKDAEVLVPLGTRIEVWQPEEEQWKSIADLTTEGEELCIAKGGNGGWGNWHFRSSTNQAPERANAGLPGDELRVTFTLRLIADVGLVGLPNSGKSTLLSVVTAARPKIADYPFTTLEPQLGIVQYGKPKEGESLVVADLPGLIEGAQHGKGLGATFLRHIERTRFLLHCIDCQPAAPELIAQYQLIRRELEGWSIDVAEKPELILLTKTDLLSEAEVKERQAALAKATGHEVLAISAASHHGIDQLLTRLLKLVESN